MTSDSSFSTLEWIPSGPDDLLVFNFRSLSRTSSNVTSIELKLRVKILLFTVGMLLVFSFVKILEKKFTRILAKKVCIFNETNYKHTK